MPLVVYSLASCPVSWAGTGRRCMCYGRRRVPAQHASRGACEVSNGVYASHRPTIFQAPLDRDTFMSEGSGLRGRFRSQDRCCQLCFFLAGGLADGLSGIGLVLEESGRFLTWFSRSRPIARLPEMGKSGGNVSVFRTRPNENSIY